MRADTALRRQGRRHQRLFPRSGRLADGIHVIRISLPAPRPARDILETAMRVAPGTHDPTKLPSDLPVPVDDGGARHLAGASLPDITLPATTGPAVTLSKLKGVTVLYVYPRTGVPGVDAPPGWDDIPGARGCTPQSCGFRDHFSELKALGVAQVYGLSSQDSPYQREAAERLHLMFPLLSDVELKLKSAIGLPTFFTSGMTLYRRMALVLEDAAIVRVFYPVFPPDKNAEEVMAWLRQRRGPAPR